MARIKDINMTTMDLVAALAEGSPGAKYVICRMTQQNEAFDPDDSAIGGTGSVRLLDTLEIYGPRIWMLYKDVCGQDIVKTIGVLRAVQLGLVSRTALNAAIDGKDRLDVDATLDAVRKKLPKFGASAAEVA